MNFLPFPFLVPVKMSITVIKDILEKHIETIGELNTMAVDIRGLAQLVNAWIELTKMQERYIAGNEAQLVEGISKLLD